MQREDLIPQYDENQLMTVECKHVFFSVGQTIVWGDLLKGSKVELGRGNGAVADALTYQTAESDIFVGGDVYTGPKFAIDAIAAGNKEQFRFIVLYNHIPALPSDVIEMILLN